MSAARLLEVARQDLRFHVRRPLVWVLLALLLVQAWGLSGGNVRISTGESTVGGTEAHITSAFAQAQTLSVSVLLIYSFFLAVAAGMSVIRDEEQRVGELLHATLLTPAEYVWGKFGAVLLTFLGVLAVQLGAAVVCNHLLADAATQAFIGPLSAANYLVPGALFGIPTILFLGGTAFAAGTITRRPILVFVLPVAVLLTTLTFLITWSPAWLDPAVNRLLMLVDPSGFRWLNEGWLKVDRGVEFYNSAPIPFDAGFLASRLAFVVAGLGAVSLASWHFARSLRGRRDTGAAGFPGRLAVLGRRVLARLPGGRRRGGQRPDRDPAAVGPLAPPRLPGIESLRMSSAPPPAWRTALVVAAEEVRELLTRPGLYLFVPLIMLQATGNMVTSVGAFDAPTLLTPGRMAQDMLSSLGILVCLLLLFYMVESLQRERSSGLAPIYYASPVRTGALLAGKALGTSLVGVVILGAMLLVSLGILAFRQAGGSPVTPDPVPFLLVWGLVLVPTFLLWTAFVVATYALTGSRYGTYAVGIAAILCTLWEEIGGDGLTWSTNWLGYGAVIWSDLGLFPLHGRPLLLNRLLVMAAAATLVVLGVRWFGRRDRDAQRLLLQLRPGRLARSVVRLSPALLLPVAAVVPLWLGMESGYGSEARERAEKDYWRANLATWRDADQPGIAHVELDMVLEPERRRFSMRGGYDLVNFHDRRLERWAITPGHWEDATWTLDGEAASPDDRAALLVFDRPLAPGERVRLGFDYTATVPDGMGRSAAARGTFVLESGVVLISLGPEWVPAVGYLEGRGVDEDNRHEPREYPDDFHEGATPPALGPQGPPFTTRIRVTAPAEYTVNSVGVLVHEERAEGRRTVVWESDHPVRIFNLVAGRWAVRRGDGTALYHHPGHAYNVEEMGRALDASLHHYSRWFHPFPWRLLKVSEFPGLATYAQGFPTNITFSEAIGFLTESDPRAREAFVVTAHEAAHQWWGNLLVPGRGPGGNVLSEGMAHFSTMLLVDEVLGEPEGRELRKGIESRYAARRRADDERPLVRLDGSRPGDATATYDKGGWVAWMLTDLMGREAMLDGLQEFIARFRDAHDHPLLQDMIATLRPHAPEAAAFDAFVEQWFLDVVVPEYRLADAVVERVDGRPGVWRATATLRNVGSGRMAVEVAAIRGAGEPGQPRPEGYRDARTTVVLDAGERARVEIPCPFRPERLVVDPDVRILQLSRDRATVELTGPGRSRRAVPTASTELGRRR